MVCAAGLLCRLLFIPFEMFIGEGSTEFVKFVFLIHHLLAGITTDGVDVLEPDRLFWAHLLAKPQ